MHLGNLLPSDSGYEGNSIFISSYVRDWRYHKENKSHYIVHNTEWEEEIEWRVVTPSSYKIPDNNSLKEFFS